MSPSKPRLPATALLDLSAANFASAIAFALQQGNMARIFQTLGADLDRLPILMIAGPITGLLVQPLIGHASDHGWVRIGRWGGRRLPYMVAGALASAAALCGMAFAGSLVMAIAAFWVLDAALNVVIEPFRALVGDSVPPEQRASGLAVNSALGCVGAVIGFVLPFALSHWGAGQSTGAVPASVRVSLLLAAGVLLAGVGWTALRVRETPPEAPERKEGLGAIWRAFVEMPRALRRLAAVHFCTWFALFLMWPFMVPVITSRVFHALPGSAAYQAGADWVGVLYAGFNVAAAVFGFAGVPWAARRLGVARAHAACLGCGVLGFAGVMLLRDPVALFGPFALLGVAWASLLTLPYVMLTDALGGQRLGIYTGIFNIFVVAPQIAVSVVMGPVLKAWFPGEPVWTMGFAAAAMALAAGLTLALRPDRA